MNTADNSQAGSMLSPHAKPSARHAPSSVRYRSQSRLCKLIRRLCIQKMTVENPSSPEVEGFASRSIHACGGVAA